MLFEHFPVYVRVVDFPAKDQWPLCNCTSLLDTACSSVIEHKFADVLYFLNASIVIPSGEANYNNFQLYVKMLLLLLILNLLVNLTAEATCSRLLMLIACSFLHKANN